MHPGIVSFTYPITHSYLPRAPDASLRGTWEPVQTSVPPNTKQHSLVEITRQAHAFRLQTRDKRSMSGTHSGDSLESRSSSSALYSLQQVTGGEKCSRQPSIATQRISEPLQRIAFCAISPVSPPPSSLLHSFALHQSLPELPS